MSNRDAVDILAQLRGSGAANIRFLSPIVAAMLKADRQIDITRIEFSDGARSYAETVGLIDSSLKRGGRSSYSPLTRLESADDIERCTDVIASCLHQHLDAVNPEAVKAIAKVLGELHDNVSSHARGVGYSMAHVYKRTTGPSVELAVVDQGCGLLSNVRRVAPHVTTHQGAIEWSLEAGNTSARVDDWAQRLPEDFASNPYPPRVQTRVQENNHQGLGLAQLVALAKEFDGELWLCTGDTALTVSGYRRTVSKLPFLWNGFAVEVVLRGTQSFKLNTAASGTLQKLGRRLGV